jgi:serine/threonine-protein kinase HipA
VHQEDFCQALGHQSESKYAAEGGPTFKTSFSLVRSVTTRPAIEVLKLLDATIFNLIIGNADAHGKNFSLLYSPSDGTVLAPLYDLLCTMAWPQVATRMAMKIGGAGALEELSPRAWEKFSEDAGLRMPFVRKRVLELCQLVAGALQDTEKDLEDRDLSGGTVRSLGAIIAKRAAGVASVSDPKTA